MKPQATATRRCVRVSSALPAAMRKKLARSRPLRRLRRVLITGGCAPDAVEATDQPDTLARELEAGALSADQLVQRYCALLYARTPSYVEVARITGLDRRTVKKQIELAGQR